MLSCNYREPDRSVILDLLQAWEVPSEKAIVLHFQSINMDTVQQVGIDKKQSGAGNLAEYVASLLAFQP